MGVGLENSMGPKGSNVVGDFEKPAGGKSSNNKILPNSGFRLIYHGTKYEKERKKKSNMNFIRMYFT